MLVSGDKLREKFWLSPMICLAGEAGKCNNTTTKDSSWEKVLILKKRDQILNFEIKYGRII